MIKLRDYQGSITGKIINFFSGGGKHTLVQAPTGAGKTVIFSYIAQRSAAKNKKVLILTNRTELLKQTGGTLQDFGLQPYFIQAGTKFINFNSNCYVAMTQTLRNRLNNPLWRKWIKNDIDLVIIDEAHKQDFNYIFEDGILDDKYVLGFTATPRRTGKMRQLALDYEEIIDEVSVTDLIDKGFLVSDDYYGVGGVDVKDIKIDPKKGDYSEADMFKRFDTPKLYAGVVKNWMEIAPNTKTIVFCVNIEHVIHTCEEFHKNGIDARFIVSSMSNPKEPSKEATEGAWTRYEERLRLYNLYLESWGKWSGDRTSIIQKFKNKEFPVLINAGILTTGFDDPSIETVVVNRATMSLTLYFQMVGRGSRISPKKTHFTLLDFGNNASRLGHYTAPQLWSLWHETSKGEGTGVPPVKICGISENGTPIKGANDDKRKGCECMIMASITICPFCGFKYPNKKIKEIDLTGLMYDVQKKTAIAVKKIKDMNDDELLEYFLLKNHKMPWLWRNLYFRGGTKKIEEFGEKNGWKKGSITRAINYTKGL